MANEDIKEIGMDLEEKKVPDFLPEDDWLEVDIDGDFLDPADRYERPKYTLSMKGAEIAPLGGIHALTGQPGNGKTMLFTQIIVAILKGAYGYIRYCLGAEIPKPVVLYVDTEMEKGNTQLVQLRIYSLMGWTFGEQHPELRILALRETEKPEDRWRKILKAIYQCKPNVCLIDGLLDVVSDFNDNEQCARIITKCMMTASHYNISLWCLVHENPGQNSKMVGHLGSTLQRKVTDVLSTVKTKEGQKWFFTIKQKKARGKDVDDIMFTVEDGPNKFGIPMQIINAEDMQSTKETPYGVFVRKAITKQEGETTRDFLDKVKKEYSCSTEKAQKRIEEMMEQKFINRTEDKRYHIYDFNTEQEDVPF